MSQDGSTVYPLSGEQVRTLARVKLEFINLFEENKNLHQIIIWCDSIDATQKTIIKEKNVLLNIKDDKIRNLQNQNEQEIAKYSLANDQIKKERKNKYIFMGTTIGAVILLTISLFN